MEVTFKEEFENPEKKEPVQKKTTFLITLQYHTYAVCCIVRNMYAGDNAIADFRARSFKWESQELQINIARASHS